MNPLEALQTTLAGEHAATYVYGVLGGRVSTSAQPELASILIACYTTHRGRRDQLVAMVRRASAVPIPAEVSYALSTPALSAVQLEREALQIEQRCTATYAEMVGSTSGANRQWAINALTAAAVRQLALGGTADPFPGVAEL